MGVLIDDITWGDVLAIDIGNSSIKCAVVRDSGEILRSSETFRELSGMATWLNSVDSSAVTGMVVSSVRKDRDRLESQFFELLESHTHIPKIPVLIVDGRMPLPLKLNYTSPESLGPDRIAAAMGAYSKYGGNCLIADAGTALTIDLLSGQCFMGGNISPGLTARFKALNIRAEMLPLLDEDGEVMKFGQSTSTAIRTGVVAGAAAEIEISLREARMLCGDPRLLLTGGQAPVLQKVLSDRGVICTVDRDLVFEGLDAIFRYNEKYRNETTYNE